MILYFISRKRDRWILWWASKLCPWDSLFSASLGASSGGRRRTELVDAPCRNAFSRARSGSVSMHSFTSTSLQHMTTCGLLDFSLAGFGLVLLQIDEPRAFSRTWRVSTWRTVPWLFCLLKIVKSTLTGMKVTTSKLPSYTDVFIGVYIIHKIFNRLF